MEQQESNHRKQEPHIYERVLEKLGITAYELEKQAVLGNGIVGKAIKKGTTPALETVQKIINTFPSLASTVLKDYNGKLRLERAPTSKLQAAKKAIVPANYKGEGVPVFDVEFAGGDRSESFFWEGERPIAYLNIPEVFGCDAIVRARGESMARRINPRDWVGIREIKDFHDFLPYGHIYGIETKGFGLFKYVRKSKEPGCVHLVSENPDYEPQDLALDKILRLWQVRVVIPISQILLLA